jgi:hypothetical protein
MARYDDLNTKTLGYLTFLSVVLLAVTVLLLQALCYNWIDWQEESKLIKQSYHSSDSAIQSQKDSLNGYAKVKVEVPVEAPANGSTDGSAQPPAAQMETVERVQIPIDRAQSLLLEQFKSKSNEPAPAPNT